MSKESGFSSAPGAEVFTRFWTDLMAQFSGSAPRPAPVSSQEELMKQMRQAFFDSWARYCEDFMRSDVFLDTMKRSMENALAFRQQIDEFLTKALHANQMPSRTETDSILMTLRSLEERVINRLGELTERVRALEQRSGPSASANEPRKSRGDK